MADIDQVELSYACDKCGKFWQEKTFTDPKRCPDCGSNNIRPIVRPVTRNNG